MKTLSKKQEEIVKGLRSVISETGRTDIVEKLDDIIHKSEKGEEITVTSVVPFTDKQTDYLKKVISKLIYKELPVKNILDKKILGGFTVRIGDWFLDASLYHTLLSLQSIIK